MPEYPIHQKCENIVIDEEIVFCLFLVEREVEMRSKSVEMSSSKSVDVILPKVVGFQILSKKDQSVISEHRPNDLQLCRELIQKTTTPKGSSDIIRYVFEK